MSREVNEQRRKEDKNKGRKYGRRKLSKQTCVMDQKSNMFINQLPVM